MPIQDLTNWQMQFDHLNDLLVNFAVAVRQMRELQKLRTPFEPMANSAKRAEAEDHVDQLISALLLPPIPPKPEGM